VSAILPNLLSYPWFFLLDPGGENTAVAVKHWRKRG
jgi:type IV secretion system protein VirD4